MAIKIGDKVWVHPSNEKGWVPGELLGVEGNKRRVRLESGEEITVSFNYVAKCHIQNDKLIDSVQTLINNRPSFDNWMRQAEEFGVVIPVKCYVTKKQRLAMVAALMPAVLIPKGAILKIVGTPESPVPSFKEMALIGDALWRTYLRITLIGQGYRNGDVHWRIVGGELESRSMLSKIAKELGFQPFFLGQKFNQGETAEAFLGWAYTFGGEKSYLRLAKKYLEVLEERSD